MTEPYRERPFEEKLALVGGWIETIASEDRVDEIESGLLREVLVEFGANLEERPELESLSKYSNKAKRPGLDAVWGRTRVDEYSHWVQQYVLDYEQKTGKPLPVLEGTDVKTSGMKQFLGELTAFAMSKMTFEDYKRLTEDRARKGRLWQQRDPNEPIKPSAHSSFPPEFPQLAWVKIKSWHK